MRPVISNAPGKRTPAWNYVPVSSQAVTRYHALVTSNSLRANVKPCFAQNAPFIDGYH